MTDLDTIRARHVECESLGYCDADFDDGVNTPCDTRVVLDALDRQDPFSVWQGACGHLWRKVDEGDDCPRCREAAHAKALAEALRLAEAALSGYKWLWNNRHNADTRMFRELFEAAHEDEERARAAAGDALAAYDKDHER